MKVKLAQLPNGRWEATWTAPGESRELEEIDAGHGLTGFRVVLHPATTSAQASTPWEASAMACEAARRCVGYDVGVEWETLPWTAQREAHGITQGVCELLGAGRDARRAIDAAVYADEMRELGVGEYVTLTAERRARLAAAAAERFFHAGRDPELGEAVRALKWTKAAARWLSGYGRAACLMSTALSSGYPERRRGRRLMRRAWFSLVAANVRNDIAPDSR